MTNELTTIDYSSFNVTAEKASRLEFYAARIEAGHQNAMMAMMQVAEALNKARGELPADQEFGRWRAARLPWLSENLGGQYLNLWSDYGDRFAPDMCQDRLFQMSPSFLRVLSQPAADGIREDVEARINAGESLVVADIARLKAEHKAKIEATEKAAAEARALAEKEAADAKALVATKDRQISELLAKGREKADAASRREANLIAEGKGAKDQAEAARKAMADALTRLDDAKADKARALADKDEAKATAAELAEKAAEEAWQEADEKYETIVNRLTREAAEAKQKAEAAELAAAQAKAAVQTEAQKLAETMADDVLKGRKKAVDEVNADYKRAQTNAANAYAAAETAKRELAVTQEAIKTHEAEMARWASGEAETADQIKMAVDLSEAVGVAMSEIGMLEHGPQPAAIPKMQIAMQRCRQMADALESFLAPGLVEGL